MQFKLLCALMFSLNDQVQSYECTRGSSDGQFDVYSLCDNNHFVDMVRKELKKAGYHRRWRCNPGHIQPHSQEDLQHYNCRSSISNDRLHRMSSMEKYDFCSDYSSHDASSQMSSDYCTTLYPRNSFRREKRGQYLRDCCRRQMRRGTNAPQCYAMSRLKKVAFYVIIGGDNKYQDRSLTVHHHVPVFDQCTVQIYKRSYYP